MKMIGVPFKGTADSLQELIAGRIQVVFAPPIAVHPFYEAKQLKVLAVTGEERFASMPAAPTLKESGVPITAYGWLGIATRSLALPDSIAQADNNASALLPTFLTRWFSIFRKWSLRSHDLH